MRDGGFSVNVFSNDMLSFSTFGPGHRPLREWHFVLPSGTAIQLVEHIENADSWLWNFPPRMCFKEKPDRISTIGLDGYPLFRLEDFQEMATVNEFRSIRGHYAREMMNLIEEIAALLDSCGFQMTLHSFGWLETVRPLPETPPAQQAPLQEEERRVRIG